MDSEMLKQFYHRYAKELYLYLFSLCQDKEAARDLLQEVFLKALLSWNDENGNLRAWLYRVARNTCFNHLKKAARELPLDEEFPGSVQSPLDSLILDEKRRILYEGMNTLPARQREILELFYFAEMNTREIAALLNLTPENVRVLSFRAKKALKKHMEVNGYEL